MALQVSVNQRRSYPVLLQNVEERRAQERQTMTVFAVLGWFHRYDWVFFALLSVVLLIAVIHWLQQRPR